MSQRTVVWHPVPDVAAGFGSISYRYGREGSLRTVYAAMHGERTLRLHFTGVVAVHAEDDCPGIFSLPKPLPRLDAQWSFPLLQIENSDWLSHWPMYPNKVHFALLSLDDLVNVIADATVKAHWEQ